jgi:nitroreductase
VCCTVTVTDFDLSQTDRLLTTTKQVRKRLDLSRPVPVDLVLDCIDIASAAPMGGNLERNRWLLVTDQGTKDSLARLYADVGAPYLDANAATVATGTRQSRVVESGRYLVDHLAEVPMLVIALRLDRLPDNAAVGDAAAYYGSVLPGVWSFQLAARSRGLGSAWTTFHLGHEAAAAELLGIPATVTQVALLPVAWYTGEGFTPAPRRPAEEITFLDRWKQPVPPRPGR